MTRDVPQRADFAAFIPLTTRWSDNDAYGHMNNATYLSLFDTALSVWQMGNGIAIQGPDALRFLVVETGCRYHAEAGFPDQLTAGLRLGHLGRSSVRFDFGLFRNGDTQACASAHMVQVLTDAESQPMPIPEHARSVLNTLA
jgi:acyl-CoA thioester hydrolase